VQSADHNYTGLSAAKIGKL